MIFPPSDDQGGVDAARDAVPILPPSSQGRRGLTIRVSSGTGTGSTRLAAFDAALRTAGVADFNLVHLSSVIPTGSTVLEVDGADQIRGGHGDMLMCVYAASWTSIPHSEAWAGLAWSEHVDGTGAGLFVEHSGLSQTQVETELADSLADLSRGRGSQFHAAGSMLGSIRCTQRPVCALVIASFAVRNWCDLAC